MANLRQILLTLCRGRVDARILVSMYLCSHHLTMYTIGGVTAHGHEGSSQTYHICRTQEAALGAYALAIAHQAA